MVLALAALPILVIIIQAVLWRRDLRLRATSEWRAKRLVDFLNTELESPCRRFGHAIVDGACQFCEDLQYYAADWWDEHDFITMSSKYYDKDDPRLLGLIATNGRYANHHTGYAIVDPERKAKVDKYHRHARELPARSVDPTMVLALSYKHAKQAEEASPPKRSRGRSVGAEPRSPGGSYSKRIGSAHSDGYPVY